MTVVGLQRHYDGDESIFERLWTEFGDRWDEFEDLAATDEAFGVTTNFQPEPMEFDYVVGVATGGGEEVPDDFTSVEVPGGSYACFETTLESFESDYDEVVEGWLPDSGYGRRPGPEYARYGESFEPEDPASA